jgi:hypothetical protein
VRNPPGGKSSIFFWGENGSDKNQNNEFTYLDQRV